MRRLFVILCTLISLPVFSQNKSDLGVLIGGAFYLGNLNPAFIFYSPQVNAGITYRYNMNQRYVLKGEFNYMVLTANNPNYSDPNKNILWVNSSFKSELYDFAFQFEFNFLPLKFNERKMSFSPFVSTGIATSLNLESNKKSYYLDLPFAVGIRATIGKKWSTGIQWNFRDSFSQKLDGIPDPTPPPSNSSLNNNDWYSFAGFFITYKVFDFGMPCPAYEKKF